jgi:hypothetical protein
MDPINYMLDVKNPIEEAIRGYTMGRNEIAQRQDMQIQQQNATMQQKAFEDQQTALQAQRAAAEKAVAAAAAGQAAITALIDLGDKATPDDFMRTWAANPAMRDEITTLQTMMTEPKTKATIQTTQNLYVSSSLGNVEATRGQIQTQYDAAVNSGDEAMAQTLKVVLDQFEINPEAAMQAVKATSGLTLGGFIGFDKLKLLNEAAGIGAVEAADVQSALVGKLATVIVRKNGVVEVRDNRTNQIVTGVDAEKLMEDDKQLMADINGAVEQSGAEGRLQAVVDLGAVAAAADAGGKAAVNLSIEAFKQISNIRSNILNLDRAIQLVEEEGANTGVIASKLPTWGQATLELENLQKTLGLDVIGAVTFGALSQSELDLAQTVALPTNLNEKELADWLRRKKTAQEKLANYLSQQSRFFSRGYPPGRWFDFLDSGEKDMTAWMRANPPGKATPAATETATAPETPTAATPAGETEESAFLSAMTAKNVRGEAFTQAEINRLNVIAAKGK